MDATPSAASKVLRQTPPERGTNRSRHRFNIVRPAANGWGMGAVCTRYSFFALPFRIENDVARTRLLLKLGRWVAPIHTGYVLA